MSGILEYLGRHGNAGVNHAYRLPLMHTANGEDFVKILRDRKIDICECSVFNNEKLVYFFLGRPAYKTEITYDPSYWQLPAVFIFGNLSSQLPKRIFPFDTGAFKDRRFEAIIGRMGIDQFNCGNDIGVTSQIVRSFFETEQRYRRGQPVSYDKVNISVGNNVSNVAPLALAKLYNSNFNNEIDDRARLIEIQYDQPIELELPQLSGVICCREWLRDPAIEDAMNRIGCRVESYPILPLSTSSYYSKIYEIAETFNA